MRIDLHVHTLASHDGLISPHSLVKSAAKRGLQGVAVTDHNTLDGYFQAKKYASDDFVIIPGVEYSTDHGHILALFCDEFAKSARRDSRGLFMLKELSEFIRERGGVLIVAHPFSNRKTLPNKLFDFVDGLESFNSRELSRNAESSQLVEKEAKINGVITTGGSDGHLPFELGTCYTEFPHVTRDLRRALLKGECKAGGRPGRMAYRLATKCYKKLKGWGMA